MFNWVNAVASGALTLLIVVLLTLAGHATVEHERKRAENEEIKRALRRLREQNQAIGDIGRYISAGTITAEQIAAGTVEAGNAYVLDNLDDSPIPSGTHLQVWQSVPQVSYPIASEAEIREAFARMHGPVPSQTWQEAIDNACDYYARYGDEEALAHALVLTEAAGDRAHERMGHYTGVYHVEWVNGRRTGRLRSDEWRAEHPRPAYLGKSP